MQQKIGNNNMCTFYTFVVIDIKETRLFFNVWVGFFQFPNLGL